MGGVCALANRAQAVQRRNPYSPGEVAIRAATDRNLRQRKAQLAGNLPGQLEQHHYLFRSLHWRTIDAALDLDPAFWIYRPQLAYLAFQHPAIRSYGDAKVHFGHSFRSDDIRARTSADDSNVERDRALQIGQARDGLNLVRELKNRALAFFKVEPGVRRLSRDLHEERPNTFARRLQGASGAGRFANQDRGTLARNLLSQRARAFAAAFFVGNQQHRHRARQAASDFARGPEGTHHLRNAALHVENTGAVEPAFVLAPRHRLKCPDVVHGIEVAEQQHWLAAFGARESHLQVVPG